MVTRAQGKETMLSEAKRQEQYNKLKEEELHCRAMQMKLQEQRQMLEKNASTTTPEGDCHNQPTVAHAA